MISFKKKFRTTLFMAIVLSIFMPSIMAQKVSYKTTNETPSNFWMPFGLYVSTVPYKVGGDYGLLGIGASPEYHAKKFSFHGVIKLNYVDVDEQDFSPAKAAGAPNSSIELGTQINLKDVLKKKELSINLKSEYAGYNKQKVTYIKVPSDRRVIQGIRTGLITSPYAEEVYLGYGYTGLQNLSVSATGYGNRTSQHYFKFSIDAFRTLHRADFYSYHLLHQENTDLEYKAPPPIGFRCFMAFNYNNIMLSGEFGQRDQWYGGCTIQYVFNRNLKNNN